ncbi:MAG: VOC family protein [Acidimicrobiia bacterium]
MPLRVGRRRSSQRSTMFLELLARPLQNGQSRETRGVDITCVTFDSTDPARIATFWNDALGWGGVAVAPDGASAICGPAGGGSYLEFVRVPEDKIVKNRVHLGCAAASLDDLRAELQRLLDLGASLAWEEEFPPEVAAEYRNLVLRDPEGNEFCLGAGTMPG